MTLCFYTLSSAHGLCTEVYLTDQDGCQLDYFRQLERGRGKGPKEVYLSAELAFLESSTLWHSYTLLLLASQWQGRIGNAVFELCALTF